MPGQRAQSQKKIFFLIYVLGALKLSNTYFRFTIIWMVFSLLVFTSFKTNSINLF